MIPPPQPQLLILARQHLHAGRHAEAEPLYRQLLAAIPGEPNLLHELGAVLYSTKRFDEALTLFEQAVAASPQRSDFHNNLGLALQDSERLSEAVAAFETALRLDPQSAFACRNLGRAWLHQKQFDAAITCFHRALEIQPNYLAPYLDLAHAHVQRGESAEAIAVYQRGLAHLPTSAALWNNLGNVFIHCGDLDNAFRSYQTALQHDPQHAVAANNFGDILQTFGRLDDSIAWLRHSAALDPAWPVPQSNLILALQHHPAASPAAILAEARQWQKRHAASLPAIVRPASIDRSPGRRLRLGYVSPDFRAHAVGAQMLPLFRQHDRAQFDLVCYSGTDVPDRMTAQFRDLATEWRDTLALSTEKLAAQIAADRIDILVDLALHTLGNRLPVFARRPAPVQVTFAGYPGTTGLDAIRYRLTDRFLDPPGEHDADYSEESIRLPDSFWCFDPVGDPPDVQPLPALAAGHITFGSLVKSGKINDYTLALWSRVLGGVPGSQMLILCPPGGPRDWILGQFAAHGIERTRIHFVERLPLDEYYALHHRLDLILDTFAYNGHTTTLDALWMGVPVITLAGETAVSRGAFSILSHAGDPEFASFSPDDFVRCATALAHDLPRLTALRAGLRARLRTSPLMDAARFARGIEEAYRTIWRRYCAEG